MWITQNRFARVVLVLALMRWLFVLVLLASTGCASQPSAEQLLERYLQSSDAGQVEVFTDLLAGSALQSAESANKVMAGLNLRQIGNTRFHSFSSSSEDEYDFCLDVSQTRLIDQFGNDLTPLDRPEQLPMRMRIEKFGGEEKISEIDIRRYSNC